MNFREPNNKNTKLGYRYISVVKNKNVSIHTSRSASKNNYADIELEDVIDHCWSDQYYTGIEFSIHKDREYICYGVISENNLIRILNIKNGLKNSIRLQTGPARDIKFAYSTTPILLAILDKIGNILVYNVKPNKTFSNQLGVDLLLTIIQKSSRAFCTITWCPFDLVNFDPNFQYDFSRVLVVSRETEVMLLDLSQKQLSSVMNFESNLVTITTKTPVNEIICSPEGHALAVVCSDGVVLFYQVDISDRHYKRLLHEWVPHNGEPVTMLYFLKSFKTDNAIAHWRYAITGAKNNTELKIWCCKKWSTLQNINLKTPHLFKWNLQPHLDPDTHLFFLHNPDGGNFYIFRLLEEEKKGKVKKDCVKETIRAHYVAEFILPFYVGNYHVVDHKLDVEAPSGEQNGSNHVKNSVTMLIIYPHYIRYCTLTYQFPIQIHVTTVANSIITKTITPTAAANITATTTTAITTATTTTTAITTATTTTTAITTATTTTTKDVGKLSNAFDTKTSFSALSSPLLSSSSYESLSSKQSDDNLIYQKTDTDLIPLQLKLDEKTDMTEGQELIVNSTDSTNKEMIESDSLQIKPKKNDRVNEQDEKTKPVENDTNNNSSEIANISATAAANNLNDRETEVDVLETVIDDKVKFQLNDLSLEYYEKILQYNEQRLERVLLKLEEEPKIITQTVCNSIQDLSMVFTDEALSSIIEMFKKTKQDEDKQKFDLKISNWEKKLSRTMMKSTSFIDPNLESEVHLIKQLLTNDLLVPFNEAFNNIVKDVVNGRNILNYDVNEVLFMFEELEQCLKRCLSANQLSDMNKTWNNVFEKIEHFNNRICSIKAEVLNVADVSAKEQYNVSDHLIKAAEYEVINEKSSNEEIRDLVIRAITEEDSFLLIQLCEKIDVESVFFYDSELFEQQHFIKLLQNLSKDLIIETELRLNIMELVTLRLDIKNPIVVDSLPDLVAELTDRFCMFVCKYELGEELAVRFNKLIMVLNNLMNLSWIELCLYQSRI